MKELEQAAQASVGKACGFAGFAIILTVVSLSFDPVLAARWGAVLTLALAVTLAISAFLTAHTPGQLKRVWVLTEESKRRKTRDSRRVLEDARRQAMLWFAAWSALASVLFATAALVITLFQGA